MQTRIVLEDQFGIGLSYLNLAETERLLGDINKNIEYLNKASEIFLSLKNYLNLKQAYGKLAEAYEFKKDFTTSLKYYQLYANYKDSIYNEENAKQMAEMQKFGTMNASIITLEILENQAALLRLFHLALV